MNRVRLGGLGAKQLARGSWRVVVTGASGWLGMATLDALAGLLGEKAGERLICFGSTARRLTLRDGASFEQRPLAALSELPPARSLVLHLAYLTQEKAKAMTARAYAEANRGLSRQVLNALDPIGARAVFLPSSGAVYRVDDPSEEDSKRLYGRLKIEDERLFADWAARRGARAVIARIFNLAGPYINKQSSYALAAFIADALADRPIRIHAGRPVFRSYVAIGEMMSLAMALLTSGGESPVFDTAGELVLEMGELAQAVQQALGRAPAVERSAWRDGAADRYVGQPEPYRTLRNLNKVTPVSLEAQILQTAAFMGHTPDPALTKVR